MLKQLDTLIGLVVVMSLVSLVITIITRMVSSLLGLRGKDLADAGGDDSQDRSHHCVVNLPCEAKPFWYKSLKNLVSLRSTVAQNIAQEKQTQSQAMEANPSLAYQPSLERKLSKFKARKR